MADQRLLTLGYRPIENNVYQNMYNGQQGGGAEMQRSGLSPGASTTPLSFRYANPQNAFVNNQNNGSFSSVGSNPTSSVNPDSKRAFSQSNGSFSPYVTSVTAGQYPEGSQQTQGTRSGLIPAQPVQDAAAQQAQQAQQQQQIDPATGLPIQNPMEGHPLSFLQPMGQIMGHVMGQGFFGPNGLFSGGNNSYWHTTESGNPTPEQSAEMAQNPIMQAFGSTSGQGYSEFNPQYGFFKNSTMNREPVQTASFAGHRSSA